VHTPKVNISCLSQLLSTAEEKNAENLLVIKSKNLVREYVENWEKHKEHSERYKGK
jgi:hypothetical protein